MAKFTAGRDLNMAYHGHDLHGPAGTVFRLPDSMRAEFDKDYGYFGLTWIEADEIATVASVVVAAPEAQPGIHIHDEYAIVTHAHTDMAAHIADGDPHVLYALDADLANHETDGHVHNHDASYAPSVHAHAYAIDSHAHSTYSATGHTHTGVYEPVHSHPYAASVHAHAYAAEVHAHAYAEASHAHLDADIPVGIARDTEVSAAIVSHEATAVHGGGPGGPAFPVGSVFLAVVNTNPAGLLGYGTWAAFGAGRMLVGQDPGNVAFDTAEETGGAATHTHAAHSGVINHTHPVAITDPGHTHVTQRYPTATGGSSGFTADTSMSGTPAANTLAVASGTTGITASSSNPAGGVASLTHDSPSSLPPYIVVYMWKRTA